MRHPMSLDVETKPFIDSGPEIAEFYDLLLEEYNAALDIRMNLIRAKFRKVLKRFKYTQVNIEVLINPPIYDASKLDDENTTFVAYHVILTNRRKKKVINSAVSTRTTSILKNNGFVFDDDLSIFRNDSLGTLEYYFYDDLNDLVFNAQTYKSR